MVIVGEIIDFGDSLADLLSLLLPVTSIIARLLDPGLIISCALLAMHTSQSGTKLSAGSV